MAEITLVNGLVGGVVATIVMTVLMMALGDDSPPPTAMFWSRYVAGGDPGDYMMQGMVLHLLYGLGAGVVLALVLPAVGFASAGLTTAVGLGVAYSVVLFVVAAVFWMNVVLDIDAELPMVGMFLLFHLVYGVVLGAWLGAGVL